MFWMILGLLVWSGVHLFKRVMPKARAFLDAKMGEKGAKGLIAILIVASVVMIIVGFKQIGWETLYVLPMWLRGIGTVFAFLGIVLMGAANSKSRIRGIVRHPMLTGIILWSAGHFMITGMLSAVVFFGGMLIWAIVEILMINKQEPTYTPYTDGTARGDVILLVASVIVTIVVLLVHYWLIVGF